MAHAASKMTLGLRQIIVLMKDHADCICQSFSDRSFSGSWASWATGSRRGPALLKPVQPLLHILLLGRPRRPTVLQVTPRSHRSSKGRFPGPDPAGVPGTEQPVRAWFRSFLRWARVAKCSYISPDPLAEWGWGACFTGFGGAPDADTRPGRPPGPTGPGPTLPDGDSRPPGQSDPEDPSSASLRADSLVPAGPPPVRLTLSNGPGSGRCGPSPPPGVRFLLCGI